MSEWESLRRLTQARIGIGRAGYAVPTKEQLRFQLDHARAKDAVHLKWDKDKLIQVLKRAKIPSIEVKSQVQDRTDYLIRPDRGRALDPGAKKLLGQRLSKKNFDIMITISNGLSSSAVNAHAAPFLGMLWKELVSEKYKLAPIVLTENARVAISDEIGALAKARLSLILIGERPGLTSVDSLAVYLTYRPRVGTSDAHRNCISNIRPPEGLSYRGAVHKTLFLVREALRRELSGVELKEEAALHVRDLVCESRPALSSG